MHIPYWNLEHAPRVAHRLKEKISRYMKLFPQPRKGMTEKLLSPAMHKQEDDNSREKERW